LKETIMSDLDLTNKTNVGANQNTGSSQNLRDQVAGAGAEMKQRAGEALQASADVARDKFKEASDIARDAASETADKLQDQVREKQQSGADFVERFAGNIREAARAFENDAPFAARGMNSAAEYVEDAAQRIREGGIRDFIDNATDFARRQPAAFLGISVLAGFTAVRFLRASGASRADKNQASSAPGGDARSGTSSRAGEGWRQGASQSGRNQTSSSQHGGA
jgi:HD-GYP domain-containing protein (c-di-GMP phosphodiesterase class II)